MSKTKPGVEFFHKDDEILYAKTADHGTTDDHAPKLKIHHSYHTRLHFVRGEEHHVTTSYLSVKNTSKYATLSQIEVYIDLDDSGNAVDAFFCDTQGKFLSQQGSFHLSFDALAPGQSSKQKPYHWTLAHRGNPRFLQKKDFTVTPKISPSFQVSYDNYDNMFDKDVTKVVISSS